MLPTSTFQNMTLCQERVAWMCLVFFCFYSETRNANIDMVAREIFFPFWKPFNIFSDRLGKVVFNLFNLKLYSLQIMTHFLFHSMRIYGKKCKTATHKHTHSTYIFLYVYNKCTAKHIWNAHTYNTQKHAHYTKQTWTYTKHTYIHLYTLL